MKHIAYIIIALLGLTVISCGPKEAPSPDTLEGKKALLDEKEKEVKELQASITKLQEEIIAMSPELQEKPVMVEQQLLESGTFTRYIDIQGMVSADDRANVVSEVPGRILTLTAKEGDYVKKGQLIATIDMESVKKQVEEINTALSLAKDVYDRQSRLWEQRIGSEVQYLQAKNNVERLEKTKETLAHQLTKANVYAPISGVVDMENIKQGEVASPGMPILMLLNTSKLRVKTDLPERFLKVVKRGDIVNLNFASVGAEMKGKVSKFGRSIDAANRTLEVEIMPLGSTRLLKPNLMAEVQVEEFSKPNTLTVPSEYVLQQLDGTEYVFVIVADGDESRAAKRIITTGEDADGVVEVLSGLKAGERIVSRGARTVSDGALLAFN